MENNEILSPVVVILCVHFPVLVSHIFQIKTNNQTESEGERQRSYCWDTLMVLSAEAVHKMSGCVGSQHS